MARSEEHQCAATLARLLSQLRLQVSSIRSADEGVDRLRNWSDLHQAFRQFGHCDDGSVAEGWSDKVVEMLATQWKTLPQLNAIVAAHPDFAAFVIRHIDETASWTSAQTAERNAKTRCPKQAPALCSRIEKRVDELRRDGAEKR
jgi:hypothetical protein